MTEEKAKAAPPAEPKQAPETDEAVERIPLVHPRDYKGERLTEIVVRRQPLGQDFITASGRSNGNEALADAHILSAITGLPVKFLGELHLADYLNLTRHLVGFTREGD